MPETPKPTTPPPDDAPEEIDPEDLQTFPLPLPEAPAIAWMSVYPLDGSNEVRLTTRANTIEEALDDLINGVKYAEAKYGMTRKNPAIRTAPTPQPAVPTSTTSVATPAAPLPPGAVPPPPVGQPAAAVTAPAEDQTPGVLHSYHVVSVLVTPQANGKTKVEFFGNDKKLPVNEYSFLSYINTPDGCATLFKTLGPWTAQHFSVASRYDTLNVTADWEYSTKRSSRGTPYKNVVGLRVA